MTKDIAFLSMWGILSSAMWDCLDLLNKGKLTELRETMAAAIEEADQIFETLDLTPSDIKDLNRKLDRRDEMARGSKGSIQNAML